MTDRQPLTHTPILPSTQKLHFMHAEMCVRARIYVELIEPNKRHDTVDEFTANVERIKLLGLNGNPFPVHFGVDRVIDNETALCLSVCMCVCVCVRLISVRRRTRAHNIVFALDFFLFSALGLCSFPLFSLHPDTRFSTHCLRLSIFRNSISLIHFNWIGNDY